MKKIFVLILALFSLAKAQDKEPLQHQFTIKGVNTYLNSSDPNFRQNKFLIGFHWDSKKKINTALKMNQVDIYPWNNVDQFQDSAMLVIKPWNYSHADDGKLFNARSIQYAPYLLINSANPDQLIVRNGDTLKEIFGFKYINGSIDNNPNSPNFYKLIIDSTKKNSIILDNPWPQDFFSKSSEKTDTAITNNYLCREMYISINLSRFGNPIGSDTNLLKIELPYTVVKRINDKDTIIRDLIRFSSLPSFERDSVDTLPDGRGLARKTIIPFDETREIIITRNMLPVLNKSITITGVFLLDNDTVYHNPFIKSFSPPKSFNYDAIDSLGIRVTYLGKDSTIINWVRFETPHAQKFLRGYYDENIKGDIQDVLNRYNSNQFTQANPGSKLFRFNTIIEGFPMNWQAERYLNKLIGNLGTGEDGPFLSQHYERYVNPPDRWFGLIGMSPVISQPYTSNVINWPFTDPKSMGLINGYLGIDTLYPGNLTLNSDRKKSKYEEYFLGENYKYFNTKYFRNNPDSMSEYLFALNGNYWKESALCLSEAFIYNSFIKTNNDKYLYSNKFWWGQLFTHTWWKPLNEVLNDVSYTNYGFASRPWTGEEFNYYSVLPILLGGKGILYDGAISTGGTYSKDSNNIWEGPPKPAIDDYNYTLPSTKNRLDGLNGWDYVKDDSTGADFYSINGEHYKLDSLIQYSLSDIAQTLGVPRNRVYMARKSTRLQIRKLNDWITINNDTLMNLRLRSYYAHGYKIWYNQHPKFGSNYELGKYIDTGKISTRKLFNFGILNHKDSLETSDSSFYDLTLLSHTSDSNMTKELFIGLANRRTNPLIYENDTLRFYSTAEFDQAVDSGMYKINGGYESASYWKDQYWKRLGCREMNIKFNYQNQDTNKYCLLKIQELGANDTNLTNQFWMKEPYHHLVDTIIGQDKNLVVRLLPGEGKLLKVTVIPIGNFNGFLDYSNQRKIVSYQITQPNIRLNGSDTIRYYAVYDKYIDTNYARRKGVFIRRSKPTYRFDVTHNINWENQEYMVSDPMNIFTGLLNGDNSYTSNRQECRNPSIVIRYDNITQMIKAYIVYTCREYYDGFKYNGDVGLVVESVLDNLNANSLTIPTPIAISNYNATTRIDDWGTPVVNASYNGNYYSWSDSLYGIGIGWKRPNELYWNPNNLQKKYIPNQNEYKISVHPSLNSYSRVRLSENDCSLVWAERVWDNVNQGYLDDGNIYYTRLRISNDSLVNYIPKIDNSQYSTGYQSYYDSTVYCLNRDYYSEITRNNRFPVVYRTVEDGQFIPPGTPAEYLKYKYDKVFFEGEDVNFGTEGRAIFMVTLPSLDTIVSQLYLPKFITQNYPYKIWHQTKDLSNPNSAQGRKSTVQMLSPTYYPSDTAVTVNFMAFDRNSTPAENSDIWSLVFDYDKTDGMNAITNDTLVTSYKRATLTSINGKNVNLSAAPFSNSPYDYNVRRRIFENYYLNQDEPKIFGTQEKLFKKPFEDDGIYHLFGMKDTSQFCIFSHMIIKDENNNLYEPQLYTNKKDSVWSEWIRIKDINKLFFYTNGNYRTMNLKLQRKSDGRLFNLPFNVIAYRKLSKHIITVLNNNNQEYRFLWTKISNRFKKIQNETMLGYVTNPLESEYTSDFNKTANDEDITREIIDLREEINENEIDLDLGVNLYPNPVEEIINLNVFSNICKKVQIELINNLSQIVFSKELKTNNLTQISTEGISTGVYFLKIEDCESDKFIIKKIMIKK